MTNPEPTAEPKPLHPWRAGILFVLRLIRLSVVIFFALLLLVVIAGAVVWMTNSVFLARFVSQTATEELLREGFAVRISDVSGSPFDTVVLHDLWLGTVEGDTLLAADEVRVAYPIIGGLRGDLELSELSLSRPQVLIVEKAEGGILLPWKPSSRPRAVPKRASPIIHGFSLVDARIRFQRTDSTILTLADELFLEGRLEAAPEGPRIVAERAVGQAPVVPVELDWLSAVVLVDGDELKLTEIMLDVDTTHLRGEGRVALQGPLDLQFEIDADPIRTADVWPIVDLSDVLGHGQLEGRFRLTREAPGFRLGYDVAGTLNEDAIDDLTGSVLILDDRVEVDDLSLRSGDTGVEGWFHADLVGEQRYRAEATVWNADLTDVPIHGALVGLHPHRVNGHAVIEGQTLDAPYPHMSIRAEVEASTYLGVPFDSLFTHIELLPHRVVDGERDLVRIRWATGYLGGGELHGAGELEVEGVCDIQVEGEGVPIEGFQVLHEAEDLVGRVHFQSRVSGDVLTPDFEGTGRIDSFAVGQVAVAQVLLDEVTGRLVPFEAEVTARGWDGVVLDRAVDSLWVEGTVRDTVWVHSLTAVRRDTTVTLAGHVVPMDGDATGTVRRVDASLPLGELALARQAELTYGRGGVWRIGPATLTLAGGELDFFMETEAEGTRPHVELRGRNIPLFGVLNLNAPFPVTSAPSDFSIEYQDDPTWPTLVTDARLRDLRVGDVHADELAFRAHGEADSLHVSDFRVRMGEGEVLLDASLGGGEGSPVLDLLGPTPASSVLHPSRELNSSIQLNDLDVDLIGRIRGLFVPEEEDSTTVKRFLFLRDEAPRNVWQAMEGQATATVVTSGPLTNPSIRTILRSDSLAVRGQVVETLDFSSVFSESLLTISQCDIVTGGHLAQITGFIPASFDISTGRGQVLDSEMLLSLDLAETPSTLLSILFPDLLVAGGNVTGSGHIAGTPVHPQASGDFTFENGGFRWAGRTEELWDAQAQVELIDDGIRIVNFSAKEGKRGVVSGSGVWNRPDRYQFEIDLRDFVFSQDGMLGIVDGKVTVTPDTSIPGTIVPRVVGDLELKQGEIFEFPEPRPATYTVEAFYDLELRVNRIYVNTNELTTSTNIVIGDGELTMSNDEEAVRVGGLLEVIEGGGLIYGNRFTVRRGELSFLSADGFNPELDIEAETRISGPYARERGWDASNARIVATLTGKLQEPVVTLTTEPDEVALSQTEIFEYLTLGRFSGGSGNTPAGLEPATAVLINLLAQDIVRNFPYIDYVEIATAEEEPSIKFVKSLNEAWTIGYTTGVSSSPDQELSIQARLSRIFVVHGGVIRDAGAENVGGKYNFDLRMDFEY